MRDSLATALIDGMEHAGVSNEGLCAAAGLPAATLSAVLAGVACFTDAEARAIQDFFSFHDRDLPPIPVLNARRRAELQGELDLRVRQIGSERIDRILDVSRPLADRMREAKALAARTPSFREADRVVSIDRTQRETPKDLLILKRLASHLRAETGELATGPLRIDRVLRAGRIGDLAFGYRAVSRNQLAAVIRADALTDVEVPAIYVTRDVDSGMRGGTWGEAETGRHRFTGAHELAHVLLHRPAALGHHGFFGLFSYNFRRDFELQANRLGGLLLLDAHVDAAASEEEISARYLVSRTTAWVGRMVERRIAQIAPHDLLSDDEMTCIDDFCLHTLGYGAAAS